MGRSKIAITVDEITLGRVDRLVRSGIYPSRSRAIQEAVEEKLQRLDKTRLARECAKLDPDAEKAMADEGLARDIAQWPEY
jgi:Arc/MetJ-type ribon-helix-helix transcriptional regulator